METLEIVESAKNELGKFNDIHIDPGPHVYFDSKKTSYTSVTTYVGRFAIPFDRIRKAFEYSSNHGVPFEEVLKSWDYKGEYARVLGTEVHAVMEHLWKGDENHPDYEKMSKYEGMKEDFEYRKSIGESLYEKMKKVYVPIANEWMVNDPALGLAGTIDFVAYNKKTDTIDILDWKTSKSFSINNRSQSMKAPFSAYPNTNVSEYSLQLSLYKYIVEKYTNLKIGELRLFKLPGTGSMKTVKCYDMVDILRNTLFASNPTEVDDFLEQK